MEYINYKRFKGRAICGDVNIPALTVVQCVGGMIYHDGKPLCVATSANAHKFFARNDDGNGLKRGELITKIISTLAKEDDKHQARWDAIWEDKICSQYRRVEHQDHWLWNNAFYNAEIAELEHINELITL